MTNRRTTILLGVETAKHMSRMLKCVGFVYRKRSDGTCFCDTVGKGVCALACELVVEVDYQRVVPPVKGREQMKEAKEAHLWRTEEHREIRSHDLLNEQK